MTVPNTSLQPAVQHRDSPRRTLSAPPPIIPVFTSAHLARQTLADPASVGHSYLCSICPADLTRLAIAFEFITAAPYCIVPSELGPSTFFSLARDRSPDGPRPRPRPQHRTATPGTPLSSLSSPFRPPASWTMSRANKLAPEANRILFVKNLAYNIDTPALFDLFGKFGPVRQIRAGTSNTTKGTAFVVYEEVLDAKQACDKLNGFNFMNRYLVVLYHQPEKMKIEAKEDIAARQENLERMKKEHGIE